MVKVMPTINKIRLTNIVYENGDKRINDEVYLLDGNNGAILLENGGGKTVFIHTVLQAVLPHTNLGERKIRETLQLENSPAHIAIEWIINERPRRYVTTAVSLFIYKNDLHSHRYVFEYEHDHPDRLENIPFVFETNGNKRPAYKEEIADYYQTMKRKTHNARTFDTLGSFHEYIEDNYQIIHNEWESIVKINRDEGGIEQFFEHCKTTTDLYDRLLIPIVEDSIEGHKKHMFADMFEKQREGFERYRHLQNSIKEHERIQKQLQSYVIAFEKFSQTEAAYETAKQRAKGLAALMFDQKEAVENEKAENDQAWEKWQAEDKQWQIKKASFHILQEQAKIDALNELYIDKRSNYEEALEKFQANEKHLYSLRHAKYTKALNVAKQLVDNLQKELAEHDKGEVHDYEAQLEQENAKLHGHFTTQLEKLDKEIRSLKIEKQPITETMETIRESLATFQQTLSTAKEKYSHLGGQIESNEATLERLSQQLLANPDQEDMQTAFQKWTAREQWLDQEIVKLLENKKTTTQKLHEANEAYETTTAERSTIELEIEHVKRDENDMQAAHDILLEQLVTIRKNWQTIDLHLREDSVYEILVNLERKLTREREDLLYKERLAHRFLDDYANQDIFFADPFLAERLADWQNQFYVITGTDFYDDLTEAEQKAYDTFPLWPATLITTETDRASLSQKVTEVKDRLQYPVMILTLEEAKQIGQGEVDAQWIGPAHWQENLHIEKFASWKADIREVAEASTGLRKEKESELRNCESTIEQFEQFFKAYPKAYKESLREKRSHLEEAKNENYRQLEKLRTEKEQLQRDITKLEETIENYRDERQGLSHKINVANEYLHIKRNIETFVKEQQMTEQQMATLQTDIRKNGHSLDRYQTEEQFIDEQMTEKRQAIAVIHDHPVYKEVKVFDPIFTDEAEEVMMDRRQQIELAIHGIQQSYRDIVTRKEQAEKDIARINDDIQELFLSYQGIDETIGYPVDGDQVLARTREAVQEGKVEVDKLNDKQIEARENLLEQEARVKTITERYEEDFSGAPIYPFEIHLDEIADYLSHDKQRLKERETYLQGETKRLNDILADLETAMKELDKFEVAHQFNSTVITAITLTEQERTEFSYNRKTYVKQMTETLTATSEAREKGKADIDSSKQVFRKFCREEITDRKLQEMAMEGIEFQTTYEDVLAFQKNMLTTVEQADLYARNFISDKDKEVQTFINHIHNHLVNVTDQLRLIPKNTKVNVSGNWKEIFKFSVPTWTEDEGKSRIRDYMDWILEQLEADYYKDEQGLEESGKIRKQMETWLDTKQLLQRVMDHKGMKVSCRKVTNDNQVTSRLTSWEQSNKWSGGEKWSKNMTLFLGILNFVAEKRQHMDRKMKRHRAVILDNPFGKASSDHVLSPVFFIAEQLGFQIIALTAHADGKFLQDYFPILYSFRLRPSKDGTTQIMTKEKSLHHAYFRDHEPEGLERLEEREQMELF